MAPNREITALSINLKISFVTPTIPILLYSVLLMDSITRNVPRDSQVVVSLLNCF